MDYAQVYKDLQTLTYFSENTRLCLCPQSNDLYVVKRVALSAAPVFVMLKEISNPHLAPVYHVEPCGDTIDVMQAYISGTALSNLPMQDKKTAVRMVADVCDGLAELHRHGLVHRDINPKNIIIGHDGTATIIDYGIARVHREGQTADTAVLGTPGYAAPEQFGFSQSDARTDMYAVGVLLNELLTGKLPGDALPKGHLAGVVKRCVEIDPKKRYRSIEDVNRAMRILVSYNGPMDRFVGRIPGLRSRNVFVVALSVMWYLLVALFTWACFTSAAPGEIFGDAVAWIFTFLLPFFCLQNFLDVWDKIPFSKGAARRNQRIVFTILGILSILIGLIIFGLTNAPKE